MNCQDSNKLLHAYLDKELDIVNTLEFEAHVASCKHCSLVLKNERNLQEGLRDALQYYQLPEGLEDKILSGLKSTDTNQVATKPLKITRMLPAKILTIACSVLLVVSILVYQHQQQEELLISDVISGHIRLIASSHITDVISSDPVIVNNWLKSKLDYAAIVPDLEKLRFKLLGAKLEYLQNQRVASIVYSKNNKIMNLLVWPSADKADAEQEMHIKQGYKLVYWCKDYMNYWLVSDIDNDELKLVSSTLRQHNTP